MEGKGGELHGGAASVGEGEGGASYKARLMCKG